MLPSRQTLPLVDRGDSTGPNVRNVVIVGATGTEKIISEQLEGNGEVVCKTTVFESFKSAYNQDASKHLDDLKEVHLVLFVIHSGRITEETIDNIRKVHPCVSKRSALLLAGCEGKDEAAREMIVEKFRDDPFTKDVVNFMQQGIYAVGFHDISEISPSMEEMFTEDMMKDAERLRNIVKDQNSSVDLGEIIEVQHPEVLEGRSVLSVFQTWLLRCWECLPLSNCMATLVAWLRRICGI